jgi:formate hydrogenlyase transcriptional activator
MERAVIVSPGPALIVPLAEMERHTASEPAREDAPVKFPRRRPVRSILSEVNRDQIINALKAANGRIGGVDGAASQLGLKRTTLITRMKKLGIDPNALLEGARTDTNTSDSSDAAQASSA